MDIQFDMGLDSDIDTSSNKKHARRFSAPASSICFNSYCVGGKPHAAFTSLIDSNSLSRSPESSPDCLKG